MLPTAGGSHNRPAPHRGRESLGLNLLRHVDVIVLTICEGAHLIVLSDPSDQATPASQADGSLNAFSYAIPGRFAVRAGRRDAIGAIGARTRTYRPETPRENGVVLGHEQAVRISLQIDNDDDDMRSLS